jgi:hypothetical protein
LHFGAVLRLIAGGQGNVAQQGGRQKNRVAHFASFLAAQFDCSNTTSGGAGRA